MVYTVLDDQSDTCFVTDKVYRKLALRGPQLTIELGTMHAVEDIKTQRIDGLIVSLHDGLVNIPLSKLFPESTSPQERAKFHDQRPLTTGSTFDRLQRRFLPIVKTSKLAFSSAITVSKQSNLETSFQASHGIRMQSAPLLAGDSLVQ